MVLLHEIRSADKNDPRCWEDRNMNKAWI
uniref:Uncharacterized protein n=1 Tax=Arundo donax TaxID=35708 RepID=A0A0A9AYF8_ARUDO